MQHRSIDYTFHPSRDVESIPTVSSSRQENIDPETREKDIAAFDRLVASRALKRPGVAGDRCESGNECGRTGCENCQQ